MGKTDGKTESETIMTEEEIQTPPNKKKWLSTAIRKKKMVEALKQTLGIVSAACEIVGMGRTQHYAWLENDKKYLAEVKAIEERAIDFGESALFKLIKRGNTAAVIFFLKTKGKARGYIERHEVQGSMTMHGDEFREWVFGKKEVKQ